MADRQPGTDAIPQMTEAEKVRVGRAIIETYAPKLVNSIRGCPKGAETAKYGQILMAGLSSFFGEHYKSWDNWRHAEVPSAVGE